MLLANRYRWHAGECLRVAQHINDPVGKALLMQMAETWTRLADRPEALPDPIGSSGPNEASANQLSQATKKCVSGNREPKKEP
jgi:hypothetical protein